MSRVGIGAVVFLVSLTAGAGHASAGTQGPTKSLGKAKGLEYRTAKFPDVASLAGATVACKSDTFAWGGGGLIDGGDGLSNLYTTAPPSIDLDGSADAWQALAESSGSRDERTYAICGKNPLSFIGGPTSFPSTPGVQTASAGCTPPDHVVSGGILNDSNPVRLLESIPIDTGTDVDSTPDDGWQITAENTSGSASNPIIVIGCSPTAKVSYVEKTANVAQDSVGKAAAKCPRRTVATGGGFDALSGGNPSGLVPWDSKDKEKVPEDGWQAHVYNATLDTLQVTSHAICLRSA